MIDLLGYARRVVKVVPGVVKYLSHRTWAALKADERTQYEDELYKQILDILKAQQDHIVTTGRDDPAYLQAEMTKAIDDYLQAAAFAGATAAAVGIGIGFDPAAFDVKISDWVKQYSFDLIKGINETTRELVKNSLVKFNETPGMNNRDLFNLLEPAFGQVRAQMIAVTEVTRAYSEANSMYQDYMTEVGVESMREWRTSRDEKVCPICSPMNGQQVKQGDKFKDDFGNEYDNPPAHVRCRCGVEIRIKA